MKKLIIWVIITSCCLTLAGCVTKNDTSEAENNTSSPASNDSSGSVIDGSESSSISERVYFNSLSEEDEKLYQKLTNERGLKEWQIHSLTNQGMSFQDILNMEPEKINKTLAPGSSFMGDLLTEKEFETLVFSGIKEDDVYVLNNLGFDYNSIIRLTQEQLDLIFPNTELMDNLVTLGYKRDMVESAGALASGGWNSYAELLNEVFGKHLNSSTSKKSNAFYQDVLLNYSGEIETDEQGNKQLKSQEVGLFYTDDWDDPKVLPVGHYFTWYLTTVWKEDISQEEKEKKYVSPFGPETGWFFPQEYFEPKVQQYFSVSTEYLRSDPAVYNIEHSGYYIGGGGGIGAIPAIVLNSVDVEEDLHNLNITLDYIEGQGAMDENKVLTVKVSQDGSYKFVRYLTIK